MVECKEKHSYTAYNIIVFKTQNKQCWLNGFACELFHGLGNVYFLSFDFIFYLWTYNLIYFLDIFEFFVNIQVKDNLLIL